MSDPLTIRTIRIRRDTASNWNQKNPILKLGEPGLETDTRKLKFGDGVSTWNNLLYTGSDTDSTILLENIDDRVANLLKAGSNISISYDDNSNSLVIDAVNIPQSKNDLGLGNVDNTSDIDKPVSVSQANADIAIQQLAASDASTKMESAKEYSTQRSNHVGTQSIDTIDNLSSTIQDINLQLESLLVAEDNIISVNGQIGEVVLTKDDIGLNNVDNTSDASKPVSSATQAALNLKANIANPTFTGTVNGITKSMVGLGNVDNTSDVNKPVSTAQASANTAVQNAAATDATTKANNAQAFAVQRNNHTGTQAISTVDGLQTALDGKASTNHTHDDRYYTESEVDSLLSAKQASGDYATLVNGTVPAGQLPSYVDDVIEAANLTALPASGESGKIYVTLDNNKTYRWSGSSYVEITASPGSTDSVPEGSVNKYYTDARANAAAPVQSVAGRTGTVTLTKSDVDLGNVDNTSDANKPVSTAQASADTAVQNAASTDATTKANAAQAFAVQRSNHTGTQAISTVDGLQTVLDGKASTNHNHTANSITDFSTAVSNVFSTGIVAGDGVSLTYNNITNDIVVSTTESRSILSLGSISGTNAISFGANQLIQTLTLNGTPITLTKGINWPSTNISVEVILRITVTSATSITWTIVNDWFNQPPAGALSVGTHLFLLRAIGSSVIEGHYIGNKTN